MEEATGSALETIQRHCEVTAKDEQTVAAPTPEIVFVSDWREWRSSRASMPYD